MKPEDAAIRLSLHLMQCGMMMPFEWVKENGEGSELQQAFRMALDALQENEELRKENGVVKEELERVRKAHEDLCGYEAIRISITGQGRHRRQGAVSFVR